MCRWFAYISEGEDCLLEDVLITPSHGLSKMCNDHYLPGLVHSDPNDKNADKEISARNIMLNVDGLGLAWYTHAQSHFNRDCDHPSPAVYKTISPPINDFNFHSLCSNTSTRLLFAHIRASSGSAVIPVNCHPFIFGRHALMHNGTISGFTKIRREMSALLDSETYAHVIGSSDSEHLAALYISILTKARGKASWDEEYSLSDMIAALCEAIGTVISIQQKVLGKDARPNSVNLAVTDGIRMICFRFRNHKVQQPPSLYWSTVAGQTLNRKYPGNHDGSVNPFAIKEASEHGQHLIVASEPTTYKEDDWNLIDRNSYVTVGRGGEVIHDKIPYQASWNVEDEQ